MKFIMRHAETADGWPDKTRHLTAKGVSDAKLAGEWLLGKGVQQIVCSGATRAVETANIVGNILGLTPTVQEDLYGAPAQRLVVACTEGTLVVAHNPGCENSYEIMAGKWGPRFEPATVACYGEKGKIELFTP